jgi:GntR family transcriptional repressor for pyruvate dehydrogenase complex
LRTLLAELGDEPSVDDLVANDLEFHRLIAVGSGNQVLCSLVEGLSGPTQRVRIWRGLTQEAAVARTLAEHRAICDAIAAGQPDVARAWATVHVAGVEQWLREALTAAAV